MNKTLKITGITILSIIILLGIITFSFENPLRSAITSGQFGISGNGERKSQTITNSNGGVYGKYSDDLVKNARGNVVIFVGARWCISCQNTDKAIMENVNEIPGNLTILNLDFDENKDILKKYSVLIQHTFIKVDNNGNLIKKEGNLAEFTSGKAKLDKIIEFSK